MAINIDSPRLMVVDDTWENLDVLNAFFVPRGYRVFLFPRGDLALKAALTNPPDLILLDIKMPEMNGYELCARLKAEESLREIPVIFISALTETQDKVKAFKEGGVDYVTKPFQMEEVHARVETHLKIARLQRELTAKYEEIKRLERDKEDLTCMIIHDLRNPLGSIYGSINVVQEIEAGSLSGDAKEILSLASQSSLALKELIDSLLDVNKMETGKFPVRMEACDFQNIIREGVQLVGSFSRLKPMLILPEEATQVVCDGNLIRRVAANLVGNALKYTPAEGKVLVTCQFSHGQASVFVEDTGTGIPKEYLDLVFDKYFQVKGRKEGYFSSSGLGLTFCRLAIEAHGGKIGVKSDIGKGSAFWFTIPMGSANCISENGLLSLTGME